MCDTIHRRAVTIALTRISIQLSEIHPTLPRIHSPFAPVSWFRHCCLFQRRICNLPYDIILFTSVALAVGWPDFSGSMGERRVKWKFWLQDNVATELFCCNYIVRKIQFADRGDRDLKLNEFRRNCLKRKTEKLPICSRVLKIPVIPEKLPTISIEIHSISMFWNRRLCRMFTSVHMRVMLLSMQLNFTLSSHWAHDDCQFNIFGNFLASCS